MSVGTPTRPARLAEGRPEPGRFWIRFWPRSWPGQEGRWVHLALGNLGTPCPGIRIDPGLLASFSPDLVYLPPLSPSDCAQVALRDVLVKEASEAGTPILVQLLPGDPMPVPPALGIYDPLETLLARRLDDLDEIPPGASVVWPLVPGLTTDPDLWHDGCRRLARSGARYVQALALDLTPKDRRSLVESHSQEEQVFEALFHGEAPAERKFAHTAHSYGLEPFLPRPLPTGSNRVAQNRQISGLLALVGELWLRLDRPLAQGQGFYRAARWIDQSTYQVVALAQEGNLRILSWLDEKSQYLIEEWVEKGRMALYDELLSEYVGMGE